MALVLLISTHQLLFCSVLFCLCNLLQDTTKPLFMKEPLPKVTVSLPIGEVNRLGGVSELSVSPWEVYSGYSGFDR